MWGLKKVSNSRVWPDCHPVNMISYLKLLILNKLEYKGIVHVPVWVTYLPKYYKIVNFDVQKCSTSQGSKKRLFSAYGWLWGGTWILRFLTIWWLREFDHSRPQRHLCMEKVQKSAHVLFSLLLQFPIFLVPVFCWLHHGYLAFLSSPPASKQYFLYTYFACVFVCPVSSKRQTAKLIGSKFCVAPRVTPGKVY